VDSAYSRFVFSYAPSSKAAFENECRQYHDFGGRDASIMSITLYRPLAACGSASYRALARRISRPCTTGTRDEIGAQWAKLGIGMKFPVLARRRQFTAGLSNPITTSTAVPGSEISPPQAHPSDWPPVLAQGRAICRRSEYERKYT